MKILLVHNDAKDIELFRSTLHKIDSSIDFESIKICKDALHKICDPSVRVDFIFLNYDLLKTDVLQILNSLKHTQNSTAVTVLLLSSITAEELETVGSLGVRYFFDRKVFINRLATSLKIFINPLLNNRHSSLTDHRSY